MAQGVGDAWVALELWALEPSLKTVLRSGPEDGPEDGSGALGTRVTTLVEPGEATPEPLTLPDRPAR